MLVVAAFSGAIWHIRSDHVADAFEQLRQTAGALPTSLAGRTNIDHHGARYCFAAW